MTQTFRGMTAEQLVNSITDFVTAGEDIPRGLVQAIRLRVKNKPEEFDFQKFEPEPVYDVTLMLTSRDINVLLGLLYMQISNVKEFLRDHPDSESREHLEGKLQENGRLYEKLNTLLKKGGE